MNRKIAFFMLPPLTQGGGAEKYFIELARNMRERGIEADIVTMDDHFFSIFVKLLYLFAYRRWFRYVDISGRESEKNVKNNLGKSNWLKTNFKNLANTLRNYDVIYSKNEIVDLILLKLKGYKNLPPVIVGVHTPLYFPETKSFLTRIHNFLYLGFFYKWLTSGSKCIHVSNISTKGMMENFKIESRLIYYPFSVEKIQRSANNIVPEMTFEKEKINIIFTGRLSEQKGVDRLVKIIDKIASRGELKNKIMINIFGSSDKKHEEIVKDLEQRYPFVKYYGYIENKYMPYILSQNDVFISTSRWEVLPYNILEAQALGLPVIAYNIPGPNDIIKDNETGFLVNNEEEFIEKLEETVLRKHEFDKLEITSHIRQKFDPFEILIKMEDMFDATIDYAKI